MKLSVIIPVYRTESTLRRCVDSVLCQSAADLEVILVDDGSDDNSGKICDDYAEKDNRVSVIHKQNGGLSSARNAGLDKAKGEYITFVDSDDYIEPGTYKGVTEAIGEDDDGCCMLEYSALLHRGGQKECQLRLPERTYSAYADYWHDTKAYRHSYAWNKVFARELFNTQRFTENVAFEDMWLLPGIIKKAKRIRTTTRGTYVYCHNENGITATASRKETEQLLTAHVNAMKDKSLCSDTYLMDVVNIQLDLYRLGGGIILEDKYGRIEASGMSFASKLKTFIINTIGIKALCRIHKVMKSLW